MARACDAFFAEMGRTALAYDDILMLTDYSEVLPADISLRTHFSRNVSLNIPIVSAAMDTVTESRMAIALAKLGGIGVIHKLWTPERQRDEVKRVKLRTSGLVPDPVTVGPDMTVEEVQRMRNEKGYPFSRFPVVDVGRVLVGLVTRTELQSCTDPSQKVSVVMVRDLLTAPPDTSIEGARRILEREQKKCLLLADGDGRFSGMYLRSDLENDNVDDQGRLRVAAAVGVGEDAFVRTALLVPHVDVIVIDTAHADSRNVIETLMEIKKRHAIEVVVGNISRGKAVDRLVKAGADGIKVGQGPGSICTTRVITGCGRSQATAVHDVAHALEGANVPVCADGGIKFSGDMAKALGLGASSVMLGSLLAATTESPGEVIRKFGPPVKLIRGMGSESAMRDAKAAREHYRQGETDERKVVPEGVEGYVDHVGDLKRVMVQHLGGIRSGMAYVGAATIGQLHERADFDYITNAGMRESHPHGLRKMGDSSNYRRQS